MRCPNTCRPPWGRLSVSVLTAAFALFWAGISHGHAPGEEDSKGSVHAVLDPLPAELSELRVQLRETLAPQLLVGNPTDQPLIIKDESGRAFLRVGPGATEGDLGAAAFHRTNTIMAPGAIPPEASEDPRWAKVEATPNWGWFDLRLRTNGIDVPHRVEDAGETASIGEWTIPVQLGDTESLISGHFEYRPDAMGTVQATVADLGALHGQAMVRAMPGSARPGLFLSYFGDRPLTLMGEQEEPFLRFTQEGVEANRNSPTWGSIAPAGAPSFVDNDESSSVLWTKVSSGRSYGWIEPRAGYDGQVEDPSRAGLVKRWQIPIQIGDSPSRIQGETEWLPAQ